MERHYTAVNNIPRNFSIVISFTGALMAGVLLYLAFGLPAGAILALVSLIILMFTMDKTNRVWERCLLYSVFIFTFIFLQYGYLVEKAFTDRWETVLANILVALIYIVPACILMLIARKSRSGIAITGFLVSEYIFTNLQIGNQMFQTGIILADFPVAIQWFRFSGIFLGSIWIALSSRFIYLSMSSRKKIPGTILIIVLPILISLFLWHRDDEYGACIKAAILPLEENSHATSINKILLDSDLSGTDMLLLPEGTVSFNEKSFRYSPVVTSLKRIASDNSDLSIFIGIFTYDGKEWTNSILAISEEEIWQRYKMHKIPFSEYLPYPGILGKSDFFRNSLLYPLKNRANDSEIYFHDKATVSPLICYEALSTDYVSEMARDGAQVFLVASSNSYIDSKHIEKINLKLIKANAITIRRPFIRATEHGWSYFITYKGETDYISRFSTELVSRHVHHGSGQTFFVMHRNSINVACGLLLILFCTYCLYMRTDF